MRTGGERGGNLERTELEWEEKLIASGETRDGDWEWVGIGGEKGVGTGTEGVATGAARGGAGEKRWGLEELHCKGRVGEKG